MVRRIPNTAHILGRSMRKTVFRFSQEKNIPYLELRDEEIPENIADLIAEQKVIGWFQGRMELVPRALGGDQL